MYHNISKKKLPVDYYDYYDLTKKEQNFYKNMWWNNFEIFKLGKNVECTHFFKDSMTCFIDVDQESSWRLYNRISNPVSIFISPYFKEKRNKISVFELKMKVMIHSVDDSQFGIWFEGKTYEEFCHIRRLIMDYVMTHKTKLNGEEFLKFCEELGGFDKDYN